LFPVLHLLFVAKLSQLFTTDKMWLAGGIQKNSPHVIKEKQERRQRPKESSRATKLTVTKVMLLKKLLGQDKPMKQLVKLFKVTDTQILRIKRGENWSDIEAAK
jgi:hypothetical protein